MKADFADKDEARQAVWDRLQAERLARFPFPPHGRIPNFAGARPAAERLFEVEPWRSARRIKVNPDAPQRPVREAALRRGIVVFVPTPRLRGGFKRLDPARIPKDQIGTAASLSRGARFADEVPLAALPAMDAIVCGSVAVTRDGQRCGKGEGYSDLEYAILRELGHPPVPVATTVHPVQIVRRLPRDPTDLPLSLIVTPHEAIRVASPPPAPAGIDWARLHEEDLEAMPLLRELAKTVALDNSAESVCRGCACARRARSWRASSIILLSDRLGLALANRRSNTVHHLAKGWYVAIGCQRRPRAGAATPGFLAIGAAFLILALVPAAAIGATEELRLVVAGPGESETHRLAEVLAEPLAEVLGRPVVIERVAGDQGVAAAQAVVEAAPDGGTLLLANSLLLAVNEAAGAWPLSLDALRPIAKLTLGISVALVAPADSEITSWQSLLAQAEQGQLRLSVPARHAASDVARALLENETGIAFEVVEAADNQASLMDVAQARADVGLVTTNSIEAHNAAAEVDLQPIVTFGARRSPRHPDTPTFAELTADDKNDFTYSFALFGPPALPDELTRELSDAIQTACAQPAALTAAGAAGLPLACHEAEVVRETVARDLRVARRALSDED